MLYCYLGPGMLAVLERWLPYTVTILDRFHCTIMVYGFTPYIREYFTREYFNTTVPSNREFKNAKNAKIANPRNINPAKIKAHTVYNVHWMRTIPILEKQHNSPFGDSFQGVCASPVQVHEQPT